MNKVINSLEVGKLKQVRYTEIGLRMVQELEKKIKKFHVYRVNSSLSATV